MLELDWDAIDFNVVAHGDDQALTTIDDAGLDQIGARRIDLDDDVGTFDAELAGVGDIASNKCFTLANVLFVCEVELL